MKKHIFTKLLSLAFALLFAANITAPRGFAVNDYGQYIFDEAGMLTQGEFESLNDYAAQLSEYYRCAVHIITTDDPSVNQYSIQQYAENTYLQYTDFGWGQDKDGFLLVLGNYDRSYWLLCYGPKGTYALTDYAQVEMEDKFLDNFRNNDWYGGFSDYLTYANYVLDNAENGRPVDVYYSTSESDMGVEAYGIAAVVGLVAALTVCSTYKKQMRTAITATRAEEYIELDEVDMKVRRDTFTFITRSQTRIAQSNNHSGGRGGTTVSSRGFSGRGGRY